MLVLSMKVGETVTICHAGTEVGVAPDQRFRHQFRCWLCQCANVLEFEPDASEPSWTECHECGLLNEIAPGVYDLSAIIPGHMPSRMF